jgi:hypothetical protein
VPADATYMQTAAAQRAFHRAVAATAFAASLSA